MNGSGIRSPKVVPKSQTKIRCFRPRQGRIISLLWHFGVSIRYAATRHGSNRAPEHREFSLC